jgi:hypothetical protein
MKQRSRRQTRRVDRAGTTWRFMNGRPDADTLARIEDGLRRAGPESSWPDVRDLVVPVLARARQPVAPGAKLVRVYRPPGLWVGFGVDLGPVFTHVSTADIARWRVDEAKLLATALTNLDRLSGGDDVEVASLVLDGVVATLVQASGWGSSLLLLPERLRELAGPEPQLVIAPVRNAIVAFPLDAPAEVVQLTWLTLAQDDPTELDGDIYRLAEGRLEPLRANPPGAAAAMALAASGRPN